MGYVKRILLTALIFIPLERVLAMRPEQKVLRRAWLNNLVFWATNGQIIGLALAALSSGMVVVSGTLVGASVQAAVAAQPYWLQFIEALVLSDIGFYFTHRTFHTFLKVRSMGRMPHWRRSPGRNRRRALGPVKAAREEDAEWILCG